MHPISTVSLDDFKRIIFDERIKNVDVESFPIEYYSDSDGYILYKQIGSKIYCTEIVDEPFLTNDSIPKDALTIFSEFRREVGEGLLFIRLMKPLIKRLAFEEV